MFCTNCGNKLADDAAFCTNCGQKIEKEEKVEEVAPVEEVTPVVEEAPVEEVTPAEEVTPVIEETPVISEKIKPQRTIGQELKRFVISPIVIVAVLCFTAFIVTSIMSAGNIVTDTMNQVMELFSDEDSIYYVEDFEDVFDEYFTETLGAAVNSMSDILKILMIMVLLQKKQMVSMFWINIC